MQLGAVFVLSLHWGFVRRVVRLILGYRLGGLKKMKS